MVNNISTDVGSMIHRNRDIGKCSKVGGPLQTMSARLYEQFPCM
jgi:hypothetical protein